MRLPAAVAHIPKSTLVLLAVVCAVHFAVGASVGLSVDEAHYALYAQHLALSYFDHPPLVGWLQWPLVALAAPTAVLRLIPEALWLLTALLVFRLGVRLQAALLAPGDSPLHHTAQAPGPCWLLRWRPCSMSWASVCCQTPF